jgi:UDP-N-acetylmuramoylalanine--D-glutamate ligase
LGGDLFEYSQKHPNPKLVIVDSNTTHKSLNLNQSKLIGAHNHQNIALAAEILLSLGIQSENTKTLLNFAGLKHRLQYLGQNKAGIHFVNDSKATAIESVDSALTATAQDPRFKNSQIFLLLGGKDKNLPWSGFKVTLSRFKNVTPVFFGYSGKIIQEALNSTNSMYFNKLEEAVRSLVDLAKQPDVILLSPGGTSLDEFKNFEDRGLQFEIYCKKYFNLITNESTG